MNTLTTILITFLILLSACTQPTPTVETKTAESEVQQQVAETAPLQKSPDSKILMEYQGKIQQFNGRIAELTNEIQWIDDSEVQKEKTLLVISESDKIKSFIDTNREALILGEYNPEYEKQKLTDTTNQLMKTLLSKQSTTSAVQEKAELPIPSQKVVAPATVNEADVLLEQCYDACAKFPRARVREQCGTLYCYWNEGDVKRLKNIITFINSMEVDDSSNEMTRSNGTGTS